MYHSNNLQIYPPVIKAVIKDTNKSDKCYLSRAFVPDAKIEKEVKLYNVITVARMKDQDNVIFFKKDLVVRDKTIDHIYSKLSKAVGKKNYKKQ